MFVPVVQVGVVRMRMDDRFVAVFMGMRLACRAFVLVEMVFVVNMAVVVNHDSVNVPVSMPLCQV